MNSIITSMKNGIVKKIFLLLGMVFLLFPTFTFASETIGTIDTTHKYAWSENIANGTITTKIAI